jgi:hypothetical protein
LGLHSSGSTQYGGDRRLADIARDSGVALRGTGDWLHRRVERIHFTEGFMIRRKVSVDFSIPPDLPPFHKTEGDDNPNVYFVPVALLRKWPPLLDFDLRGEDGCPLPLLTTTRNRKVDAAAIVGLAPEGNERSCMETLLERVATDDEPEAREALDAIGTFLNARLSDLTRDDLQAWLPVLRLCATLVGNSLLWVRVEAVPGERRIIKFSFAEYLSSELVVWRRLFAALSWVPRRYGFLVPNMGERETYHLEIVPPSELAVSRDRLRQYDFPPLTVTRRRRKRLGLLLRALKQVIKGGVQSRVGEFRGLSGTAGERAYFYVAGTHNQYGLATIDLVLGNQALISSALRASLVVTTLLGTALLARGSVVHHLDGAVALMVIFPALLALLVMRSGEHPLMRQMVSGVRFLLVSAAVLPVVDALVMLSYAHPRAGDVHAGFFVVFLVGAAISALLFLSWLLPGNSRGPIQVARSSS